MINTLFWSRYGAFGVEEFSNEHPWIEKEKGFWLLCMQYAACQADMQYLRSTIGMTVGCMCDLGINQSVSD